MSNENDWTDFVESEIESGSGIVVPIEQVILTDFGRAWNLFVSFYGKWNGGEGWLPDTTRGAIKEQIEVCEYCFCVLVGNENEELSWEELTDDCTFMDPMVAIKLMDICDNVIEALLQLPACAPM